MSSAKRIVEVACLGCGMVDLGYLSETRWHRYCPICGAVTEIISGKPTRLIAASTHVVKVGTPSS